MVKRQDSIGRTPAGGARANIVYLDDNDNAVDKSKATKAIIREFDREGRLIRETFGDIGDAEYD